MLLAECKNNQVRPKQFQKDLGDWFCSKKIYWIQYKIFRFVLLKFYVFMTALQILAGTDMLGLFNTLLPLIAFLAEIAYTYSWIIYIVFYI